MTRIQTLSLLLLRRRTTSKSTGVRHTSSRPISSETRLESSGPVASQLKSRSVIRFRGPDCIRFLQRLLTYDLIKLDENPALRATRNTTLPTWNMPIASYEPVYSAMLNSQGRFLYDFFLYRPSTADKKFNQSGTGPGSKSLEIELFADVDRSVVDEVLHTLKKMQTTKVEMENVDEEYTCWQRYGGSESASVPSEASGIGWGGNVDQTGVTCAQGSGKEGWQWYKDPRLDCLGFRGLFPSNTIPPLVEADTEAAEENFLLWRIEKGVAEGSVEIAKGAAMPLEYNLSGLNAITFDKGKELHHHGVIRKRLLPLKFINKQGKEMEQRVAPGSVIMNPASGKKIGDVTTALGSRGLGLLLLEEAFKDSAGLPIVEGNDDVHVEVFRPDWWPPEW